MCEYCGCQQFPAVSELTDEHNRLRELGRNLAAAADNGHIDYAASVAASMLAVLGPHTRVEEEGLFPAMAREFNDQISHLTAEHVAVHDTLTDLANRRRREDWADQARHVVGTLFEHILKEQDGVFPAALTVLTLADWDRVDQIRIDAAPVTYVVAHVG